MTTHNNMAAFNLDTLQTIFDFDLFKVNRQDKEDVKNNAICEILEALGKPQYVVTEDTFFSFAQKIVKRTVVDYYRRGYRMVETNNAFVHFSDGVDETGEGGADCFSHMVHDLGYKFADIRIDYHNNKDLFTPQERQAIEYFLETEDGEYSLMAEVVDKLSISKTQGSRGIKKLREIVADRS